METTHIAGKPEARLLAELRAAKDAEIEAVEYCGWRMNRRDGELQLALAKLATAERELAVASRALELAHRRLEGK